MYVCMYYFSGYIHTRTDRYFQFADRTPKHVDNCIVYCK